jgi:Tol biopolymer transport system component
MHPNPRLSRVSRALRAGLPPTVALWTLACGSGQDALAPRAASPGLVVSAAQAITPSIAAAITASAGQLAGANTVAYVSIRPGTFPGMLAALITNRRIGVSQRATLINGGLDPVPIQATVGDTVSVVIQASGGQPSVTLVNLVPATLQPGVVRTQPAPHVRDVALLDVISIVFTEPMNPATINGTTISLAQNGAPVTGQLGLTTDGLTATFRPAVPLLPSTQYLLTVEAAVAGLDGLPLGTPVTVSFTTGTASGAAVALRFNEQPGNALAGQVMASPAVVVAVDASGNIATSFTGSISVAIGSNPGGGSLSGTTTVTGGPVVTFNDLRIDRAGNGYTLVATGSGLTRATSSTFDVVPGLVGTDRVAFYSYDHGILVISGAGGVTARLVGSVGGATAASEPAWSADGTKLAFTSQYLPPSDATIYVMNADGSAVISLNQQGSHPTWSPDGTHIAFASRRDGTSHIYVMSANGSNVVRLTNDSIGDQKPAWSPDGTKIAFTRGAWPDSAAIYVMNADGSGVARLTQAGAGPAWSPDGTKVAFSRLVASPFRIDIWVMSADGSGSINLTASHPKPVSVEPTWSPDGRRIAFASADPDVDPEQIYIMNADGSGTTLLGPGEEGPGITPGSPSGATYASLLPAWAPR